MSRLVVSAAFVLVAAACSKPAPQPRVPGLEAGRGHCEEVRAGDGTGLVMAGKLILPSGVVQVAALYAADGIIRDIAAEEELRGRYPTASVIKCAGALISPGLINAHEHNAYSHAFPDPELRPTFTHRDDWRRPEVLQAPVKSIDPAVHAWVELRHLLSGATTVAGSGVVPGIVKNVTAPEAQPYVADMPTFPFGMNAKAEFAPWCGRALPAELRAPAITSGVPVDAAFVPHVAEGTGCEAAGELDAYLHYVAQHPRRKYSLIHGLAMSDAQAAAVKANDISVVWSPRSNLALYGRTLDAAALLDQGLSIALGTDWAATGSYNLFEELHCAIAYSKAQGSRPLRGEELWRMVTVNAAEALGIADKTGAIDIGKAADLVVIEGSSLERFGSQSHDNVIAVLVDGDLMALDPRMMDMGALASRCAQEIGGKRLCVDFSRYPFSFEALQARNAQSVDVVSVARQAACRW